MQGTDGACTHTPKELDGASLLHNAWMEKKGRVHDALPVLLEELALEAPRRVDELVAVAIGVEEEVVLVGVLVRGAHGEDKAELPRKLGWQVGGVDAVVVRDAHVTEETEVRG